MSFSLDNTRIAVIGLGYVGLPLAVEFSKKYPVVGFDINEARVAELNQGIDATLEVENDMLSCALSGNLSLGHTLESIKNCNVFIVTVPTPINQFKSPDLSPLQKASEAIGSILKIGDTVIYESTTYPGCTEEDCVPILETHSGLKFNVDFYCGYSPERINPGDKINTLTSIKKVTSGSTPEVATYVDDLYLSIITAGTHKAASIRVAEASKAIENAQRDVNISFVNELALIFDRMGIDTNEVLAAAGTKWNFLPFRPGLVGGHCIGVDPYYLAHKAEALGYHPQVILSGRRVNDNMGMFVANKVVKLMIQKNHRIGESKALILGITFKENCPDIRNTRVVDIYHELEQFGMQVDVYDPWADATEVKHELGINLLTDAPSLSDYDSIILAVAHAQFVDMGIEDYVDLKNQVLFDTKAILDKNRVDSRL